MNENHQHFLKRFERLLLAGALLTAAACAAAVRPACAQTPPEGAASGNTRACSANPVLAPKPNSKGANKSGHHVPPEPAPACLEVQGEAMEVQEFLQAAVRDWKWRIGEAHASEDTWSFVRYFNVEELEKYADTKVLIERVEFTGGKAALTVRTSEIGESYVRVQISTHILGEGKSTDRVMAQPGSEWALKSKGVLEQELLHELQTRFRHLE